MFDPLMLAYALPLLAILAIYTGMRKKAERKSLAIQTIAAEAGLTQPASLHPLIDPAKCLGCGACVKVCPEGDVLGLIGGKAVLVEPAQCIGHGACKTACPRGAISLVFGTETRGVDIPHVGPDFQTNVPGIFIAGELGGMGLIRNAIEQGKQAVDAVRKLDGLGSPEMLDLVIVGAGPAGFSASLAALDKKLRFVTIEQESFGGTVAHFPRGKIVMTAPVILPIVGAMPFRETTKEALMTFWQKTLMSTRLTINHNERLESIERHAGGFAVRTSRRAYLSRAVLLTIGRRGTPRLLAVPGEGRTKVVYRLVDPAQYKGQHVLVVGGGDSALEAAASLAQEQNTTVTLSYRADSFSRAKAKNRQRVDSAVRRGRLNVLLPSNVLQIGENDVAIEHGSSHVRLRNDAVIVCAGGVLPTDLLKRIGIQIETKYGTA
jgi:thioredoxin reductase (NADPH)